MGLEISQQDFIYEILHVPLDDLVAVGRGGTAGGGGAVGVVEVGLAGEEGHLFVPPLGEPEADAEADGEGEDGGDDDADGQGSLAVHPEQEALLLF